MLTASTCSRCSEAPQTGWGGIIACVFCPCWSRSGRTLAIVTTVFTQVRYRPTETGPWRAWSFTAVPATRQQRGATAAEVQAFQARLQELAVIKRAPAVATPIGFAGEVWGHLDSYGPVAPGQPPGRAVPLAGALSFGAFR